MGKKGCEKEIDQSVMQKNDLDISLVLSLQHSAKILFHNFLLIFKVVCSFYYLFSSSILITFCFVSNLQYYNIMFVYINGNCKKTKEETAIKIITLIFRKKN